MSLTIDIPDAVMTALQGRGGDIEECLRVELACALYARELASFGSAAEVAQMHPFSFGHELSRRGIKRIYGEEELADDAAYVSGDQ